MHGFALQAVGAGATASAIASRLGVTKQAAAKTVAALERQGYVERRGDVADARRKLIRRTARGDAFIEASARAFEDVVTAWRAQVGSDAVDALQDALNRLDLPSPTRWTSGPGRAKPARSSESATELPAAASTGYGQPRNSAGRAYAA